MKRICLFLVAVVMLGICSVSMGSDYVPMALIPAGEFRMGDEKGKDDARPVHLVYLDSFYMDVYEVTNGQYKKFVDATGHKAPWFWYDYTRDDTDYPVVGVSWNDAQAYCTWAGKRLPTEAEWEKAARGGLVGKKYPLGNVLSHNDTNYYGREGRDQWIYTAPVGSFAPNGYRLYDMSGNVWEWCEDWYDDWSNEGYYIRSPKWNPAGPDLGTFRIVRGGSFVNGGEHLNVAYRNGRCPPTSIFKMVGFRCVQDNAWNSSVTVFLPPWDVNKDGRVDVSDFVVVCQYFGEDVTAPLDTNPDVNGDGVVNIVDLVLVSQHFGEVYSSGAPIFFQ